MSTFMLSSRTPHGFSIARLKIDLASYSGILYKRTNANAVIETFQEDEANLFETITNAILHSRLIHKLLKLCK